MKRTYVWRNGQLVELTRQETKALPQIMPDVEDFRIVGGPLIHSRSQWREYLKTSDAIELGHSDIQAAERTWAKRKAEFRERLNHPNVREVEPPSGEIREQERSLISVEMANRLYNRPMPDRKMLIKLGLETAHDLKKRKRL